MAEYKRKLILPGIKKDLQKIEAKLKKHIAKGELPKDCVILANIKLDIQSIDYALKMK